MRRYIADIAAVVVIAYLWIAWFAGWFPWSSEFLRTWLGG